MQVKTSAYLLLLTVVAVAHSVGSSDVRVALDDGPVTGSVESATGRQVAQFLGIPFAQPPVGSLRWRKPQPPTKWSEPLLATKPPTGCPQQPIELPTWPKHLKANYSEDCLYLNVWSPDISAGQKRAVMVWIHGGGFSIGESMPYYNAKALAAIGDVVVVVIQYRLGFLGFARLDDRVVRGNLGLFDQQLALRWVHANVARFGGDPDLVTIFGESAGSASVGMHLLNEESSRYFRRAIMQSGSPSNFWACNPNTAALERLCRDTASQYLNCSEEGAEELLRCVQGKSEQQMLDATVKYTNEHTNGPYFGPTVDGEFLSAPVSQLMASGKVAKKDLIIGYIEDEAALFVKFLAMGYKAMHNITTTGDSFINRTFVEFYVDTMSKYYPYYPEPMSPVAKEIIRSRVISHADPTRGDLNGKKMSMAMGQQLIDCGVNAFTDAVRAAHDNVYFYLLTHKLSTPLFPGETYDWMGATHADDIPLVFAYPLVYQHMEKSMTEEEMHFSRRFIADLSAFARTGRPQDPNWRPYTLEKKEYYRYDLVPRLEKGGVRREECAFWDHDLPLLNGLACKQDADSKCALSLPTKEKAAKGGGRSRSDEL